LQAKLSKLRETKAKQNKPNIAAVEADQLSSEGENAEDDAETSSPPQEAAANKKAIAAGKYVPPSMRETTEDARLNRKVRGLLNRLTQSNLHSIATQLISFYNDNPQSLVSEAICATLLSDLAGMRKGSSGFVLIYAGLILFLHSQLGTQVGGYIVERLAKAFEENYQSKNSEFCSNQALMLCHLCGFGVVSVGLIYDFIKRLLESFTPMDIELLVSVLTHCGLQLRREDPGGLKEIILVVQQKAVQLKVNSEPGQDEQASDDATEKASADSTKNKGLEGLPTRVRFMIETIYDLKNNKTRKVSEANQTAVSQMKTMVKKLLKGKNEGEELRTTWQTLLTGKGRWWLVGSAFAEVQFDRKGNKTGGEQAEVEEALQGFDSDIVNLAVQQRMTTPVKKAVFCILMSSEDYLDAFEKLLRLNLKNKQDREIIHVMIHCCAQERVFNPFYGHLAAKLCSFDSNFKFTLQFALWDKFKQLPTLPVRAISNLAHLIANLVAISSLSLSVLKTLEFADQMEAHTMLFVSLIIKTLLMQFSEDVAANVFQRIANVKELFSYRERLILFLQTLSVREKQKKDLSEENRLQWPLLHERLKAATRILKNGTFMP